MQKNLGRRLGVLASTLAVILACAAHNTPSEHAAPPFASGTNGPKFARQGPTSGGPGRSLALPLNRYRLTPTQRRLVSHAESRLVQQCMMRYGFHIPLYTPELTLEQERNLDSRRYGLTDPALAAAHGYHLGSVDPRARTRHPENSATPASTNFMQALRGRSALLADASRREGINGVAVQAGGCSGESRHWLGFDRAVDAGNRLVASLNYQGWIHSRRQAEVQAVFSKWSSCMKGRGYQYSDPIDAGNDPHFSGSAETSAERRVAQADVACKQSTNLPEVWYQAERTEQVRLVQAHATTLLQHRKRILHQVSLATQVEADAHQGLPGLG